MCIGIYNLAIVAIIAALIDAVKVKQTINEG